MNKKWRWNLHGHLVMLPFSLGYILWCLLAYNARSWRWRNGVLCCIGPGLPVMWPGTGAQTVGGVQCYADEKQYARDDLHVHENVHIVEMMVCAAVVQVIAACVFAAYDSLWGLYLGGVAGAALYAVLYLAVFARYYFTTQADEKEGWHDDYMRNFLEKIAYKAQARFLASPPGARSFSATAWK